MRAPFEFGMDASHKPANILAATAMSETAKMRMSCPRNSMYFVAIKMGRRQAVRAGLAVGAEHPAPFYAAADLVLPPVSNWCGTQKSKHDRNPAFRKKAVAVLKQLVHWNKTVRGYGSQTYEPRQGRNAATVVCSSLP